MEVLGVVAATFQLLETQRGLLHRSLLIQHLVIAFEEGFLVMFTFVIIPGSHGALKRIEAAMLETDQTEGLSSLRESVGSNLDMVAVAVSAESLSVNGIY